MEEDSPRAWWMCEEYLGRLLGRSVLVATPTLCFGAVPLQSMTPHMNCIIYYYGKKKNIVRVGLDVLYLRSTRDIDVTDTLRLCTNESTKNRQS